MGLFKKLKHELGESDVNINVHLGDRGPLHFA